MALSTCRRRFYPIRHSVHCVHNAEAQATGYTLHATRFAHTNASIVSHVRSAYVRTWHATRATPLHRSHVSAKVCTGVRNCYYLLLNLTIYSFGMLSVVFRICAMQCNGRRPFISFALTWRRQRATRETDRRRLSSFFAGCCCCSVLLSTG